MTSELDIVMLTARTLPGRTIVVGDLEGGNGKSTLAVNLAAALVTKGCRVALVDTDPAGAAYDWISRGLLPLNCFHEPLEDDSGSKAWLGTARALTRAHHFVVIDLATAMPWSLALSYLIGELILVPTSPRGEDVGNARRAVKQICKARAERPGRPLRSMLVPSRLVRDDSRWSIFERSLEGLGEAIGPPICWHAEHERACKEGDWVGGVAPFSEAHLEIQLLADAVLLALGIPTITLQPTAALRRRWPADGLHIVEGRAAGPLAGLPMTQGEETPTPFRAEIHESLLQRMFRR